MPTAITLGLTREHLAVCRLNPADAVPGWLGGSFWSCTRTPSEVSVVCTQDSVPAGVQAERGWRAFEVAGPLDFGEVGILASIATPLRDAGISIFVISTYDTDYVLVRGTDVDAACEALKGGGFQID